MVETSKKFYNADEFSRMNLLNWDFEQCITAQMYMNASMCLQCVSFTGGSFPNLFDIKAKYCLEQWEESKEELIEIINCQINSKI